MFWSFPSCCSYKRAETYHRILQRSIACGWWILQYVLGDQLLQMIWPNSENYMIKITDERKAKRMSVCFALLRAIISYLSSIIPYVDVSIVQTGKNPRFCWMDIDAFHSIWSCRKFFLKKIPVMRMQMHNHRSYLNIYAKRLKKEKESEWIKARKGKRLLQPKWFSFSSLPSFKIEPNWKLQKERIPSEDFCATPMSGIWKKRDSKRALRVFCSPQNHLQLWSNPVLPCCHSFTTTATKYSILWTTALARISQFKLFTTYYQRICR